MSIQITLRNTHQLTLDDLVGLVPNSPAARELEELRARPLPASIESFTFLDASYDLVTHMRRQIQFTTRAFGPGNRAQGVIDHIRKELGEIEADPADLEEWIDVVLLSLDGAWRAGHSAEDVAAALDAKLTKNERRTWPDWRTVDRTKAIEHDRSDEEQGGRG